MDIHGDLLMPGNWATALATVGSPQTCALRLWNMVAPQGMAGTAGQTGLLQGREVGFGFLTIPLLSLEVAGPR